MANRYFDAAPLQISATRSKTSDLNNISDTVEDAFDTLEEEIDEAITPTHPDSDGTSHANVVLNDTHRDGDGSDHADVASNTTAIALNTTHRGSDGTDHSEVVSNTTAIALNTTHRGSDGTDHSEVVSNTTAIALNTTHRTSDGKNHSDVVANNTHRDSDGKNHSDVVLNNTHRTSDGKNHSDVVLNNTHRTSDGSGHADVATNSAARHAESHTVASHSDTTATGSELETLTDGSNADSLHAHSRLFGENLLINPISQINQEEYAGAALADGEYGEDMWCANGSSQWTINADSSITMVSGKRWQRNDDMIAASGETVIFSITFGSVTIEGAGVSGTQVVTPSTPYSWLLDSAATGLSVGVAGETYFYPKLERGNVATSFVHPSITEEKNKCYRYLYPVFSANQILVGFTSIPFCMGYATKESSSPLERITYSVDCSVELAKVPVTFATNDTTISFFGISDTSANAGPLSWTGSAGAEVSGLTGKRVMLVQSSNAGSGMLEQAGIVTAGVSTSGGDVGLFFDARYTP